MAKKQFKIPTFAIIWTVLWLLLGGALVVLDEWAAGGNSDLANRIPRISGRIVGATILTILIPYLISWLSWLLTGKSPIIVNIVFTIVVPFSASGAFMHVGKTAAAPSGFPSSRGARNLPESEAPEIVLDAATLQSFKNTSRDNQDEYNVLVEIRKVRLKKERAFVAAAKAVFETNPHGAYFGAQFINSLDQRLRLTQEFIDVAKDYYIHHRDSQGFYKRKLIGFGFLDEQSADRVAGQMRQGANDTITREMDLAKGYYLYAKLYHKLLMLIKNNRNQWDPNSPIYPMFFKDTRLVNAFKDMDNTSREFLKFLSNTQRHPRTRLTYKALPLDSRGYLLEVDVERAASADIQPYVISENYTIVGVEFDLD